MFANSVDSLPHVSPNHGDWTLPSPRPKSHMSFTERLMIRQWSSLTTRSGPNRSRTVGKTKTPSLDVGVPRARTASATLGDTSQFPRTLLVENSIIAPLPYNAQARFHTNYCTQTCVVFERNFRGKL